MNSETADQLVSEYVKIRDHLARERKKFTEYCSKYNTRMEEIEHKLLAMLNAIGGDGKKGIKTPSGTVFTSTIMEPRVADRDVYLDAVMDNYDTWGAGMLQVRAPKVEAMHEYMTANDGHLPPGVEVSNFIRLNVRSA